MKFGVFHHHRFYNCEEHISIRPVHHRASASFQQPSPCVPCQAGCRQGARARTAQHTDTLQPYYLYRPQGMSSPARRLPLSIGSSKGSKTGNSLGKRDGSKIDTLSGPRCVFVFVVVCVCVCRLRASLALMRVDIAISSRRRPSKRNLLAENPSVNFPPGATYDAPCLLVIAPPRAAPRRDGARGAER